MKLPKLKIRNLEIPHPIIQGGMGVGVSWERALTGIPAVCWAGMVTRPTVFVYDGGYCSDGQQHFFVGPITVSAGDGRNPITGY